ANDRESCEMLRRLELLRAVFGDMVRAKEKRPNLVTIYYFGTEQSFRAYTPVNMRQEGRVAGYYLNRPDRSVIVVSPVWDDEWAQRLIFHEYVHHLSRVSGDNPALWYTEGIAEFFSTMKEDRNQISMGLPINEHVAFLRQTRLLPLEALFGADHSSRNYNETERAGMFYAESWALIHYWYCGLNDLTPEKKAARDRFFKAAREEGENGDPVKREALFKECFGISFQQTVRDLERYVRTGEYRFSKLPMPDIPAVDSYRAAAVSRDDIRRRLAELDFRVNRSAVGKLAMLEACSKDPIDVRALEILGTDALMDGEPAVALERWQKAVDLGTDNTAILHEVAALEAQRWFSRLDVTFELPAARAESLRILLLRSIDQVPNQTLAYETLAWVEATVKIPLPKNINLVQLRLPNLQPRDRTMLALALVRARFADFTTARLLLDQTEKEATAPQALAWSKTLREFVNRREAQTYHKP
ncbi:MAG: hypothetical protein ABIV50_08515, partial [Opitutus sp.]